MSKSLRHELRGSSAAARFAREPLLDADAGPAAALQFAKLSGPQAAQQPGPQAIVINGTSGDDVLVGDDETADQLYGFEGNDDLDGRNKFDTTDGGPGDDIHRVQQSPDIVIERENEGYDRVIVSGTVYALPADAHVEELAFEDSTDGYSLSGNDFDQVIHGNDLNTILFGRGGNDTIYGYAGVDNLEGGAGSDTLIGGTGNDFYMYVALDDTLVEEADGGVDQILTSLSYTLPLYFENLRVANKEDYGTQVLTGNAADNHIMGGANDIIDGGLGADIMESERVSTFYVDNAGDRVRRSAAYSGDFTVFTSVSYDWQVIGHAQILKTTDAEGTAPINFYLGSTNDNITGNDGDNVIDGGTGIDTMTGNGGNDTYYVNSASDVVVEAAGEGNDRIYSSAASYALAGGNEVETLSTTNNAGTGAVNFTGNAFGNTIYGNAGNNILIGLGGDDRLYGWEGTNRLEGGTGDDWYFVGYGNDTVIELAGEGDADRVFTGADFGLEGTFVEILSTDWHEGTADLALGGNALNNIIIGNDGDNILYGKGGFDTIYGNGGDDIYQVSDAGDFIVEYLNDGADRIFASVDYTLYDGGYVETISTDYNAGTAAITLGGNNLDNAIIGNNGVNTLYGKGGNDTLTGHGGADTFLFTSFGAGDIDAILDFAVGTDRIAFYSSVYTGLTPGSLPASAFVNGTAAADGDDRILYNSATGALFYDADGTGATAAVQFATVTAGTSLGAADFVVF